MKATLAWLLLVLALVGSPLRAELRIAVSAAQIGGGASIDSCRVGLGFPEPVGEIAGVVVAPVASDDWWILRFPDQDELPFILYALWLDVHLRCEEEVLSCHLELPYGQFMYLWSFTDNPTSALELPDVYCDAPVPISAAFQSSEVHGLAPLTLSLHDRSQCMLPLVRRRWEFGDGNGASGASYVHTYQQPGVYDLRLTVWAESGDSACVIKPLEVEVGPESLPAGCTWLGTSTRRQLLCRQTNANWTDAQAAALALQGHLCRIVDAADQQFMEHRAENDAWLGLFFDGATWQWSDGKLLSYTNWAPGEPSGTGIRGAYLEQESGLWYAASQSVLLPCLIDIEVHREILQAQDFNHSGSMPEDWTVQSNSMSRSYPWQAMSEGGGDYAVQAGQQYLIYPYAEWLIAPAVDLSWWQQARIEFEHHIRAIGSTHSLRTSVNGEPWSQLEVWNTNFDGDVALSLPSGLNVEELRIAWVFLGTLNMYTSSWRLDDYFLSALPLPPQFSDPWSGDVVWDSLCGTLGATVYHPAGVLGTSLELRIDRNGNGTYSGEGEAWTSLGRLDDSTLTLREAVELWANATQVRYEFRARSCNGSDWGYSGTQGLEGPGDDWSFGVHADIEPPCYSSPRPHGQPDPPWILTRDLGIGVTISDAMHEVDASQLAWRLDYNCDGSYAGPDEEWQLLAGYSNASVIQVAESLHLQRDGEFRVEFRSWDTVGNGPSYSLTYPGITDDILVRVDTAAAPVPGLILGARGRHSLAVEIEGVEDVSFRGYQLQISKQPQFNEADLIFDWNQDPALAEADCEATTITGLQSNRNHWIRIRAVDYAGFISAWSQAIHGRTLPAPPAAVDDLHIQLQGNELYLQWSAPTTDMYGEGPVVIGGYQIYASNRADFTPGPATLVRTQTDTLYHELLPVESTLRFYRICALEGGQTVTPDGDTVTTPVSR